MGKTLGAILLLAAFAGAGEIDKVEVYRHLQRIREFTGEKEEAAYRAILAMGDDVMPVLDGIGRTVDSNYAYRALARFGKKALPFAERLLAEKNRDLRDAGAFLIWIAGLPEGAALLLAAYRKEKDAELREVYVNGALDCLGEPSAIPTDAHRELVRLVLTNGDGNEIWTALHWGLAWNLPEVRSAARRILSSDESEIRLRLYAHFALARLGDRSAAKKLATLTRSVNRDKATLACSYLGQLEDEAFLPDLEEALAMRVARRETVLKAIERVAGVRFLIHANGDLETFVTTWLRRRKDPAMVRDRKTADGRKRIHDAAIRLLTEKRKLNAVEPIVLLALAGPETEPLLLGDLDHPNPRVRIVVIRLLGDWRNAAAVPKLLEILEEDDGVGSFGFRMVREDRSSEIMKLIHVWQEASVSLALILDHRPRGNDRKAIIDQWKGWLARHPQEK